LIEQTPPSLASTAGVWIMNQQRVAKIFSHRPSCAELGAPQNLHSI
jgi:hypothetical protein